MRRKLIAFDIDGTLLNSQHQVLDSTLEVIEKLKAAGHFVTLATGRSLPTAQVVIDELALPNYVLCNGAYAFVDHQQIYSNPLDKEELKRLVSFANQRKIDLMYQTLHEVKQQGPFIHQRNRKMQEEFTTQQPLYTFDIDSEAEIYQAILFCSRQEEKLFAGLLSQIRFTRWGEDAMDAVPIDGSKAVTLEKIARENQFAKEDIIAFGDGENDIEMLRAAGLGIAMGNATEKVKGYADHVTHSNNQDGIWHAAKRHGLI